MRVQKSFGRSDPSSLHVVGALSVLVCIGACDSNGTLAPLRQSVPVVVSYRGSILGGSAVAILSNQTSNRLTVSVVVKDKAGRDRMVSVDLDPNGRSELGWLEGFAFAGGETITISHPNYSPKTARMDF